MPVQSFLQRTATWIPLKKTLPFYLNEKALASRLGGEGEEETLCPRAGHTHVS